MNLGKKTLIVSVIALIAVFVFFEMTNADLAISEHLYIPAEKMWILKDPTLLYRKIFYTGIKVPIYIIGVSSLIASIISWKKNIWHEHRKGLLIVTLTLIILPLGIAVVGKNITNVQCPVDLNKFGGTVPYVKHFEPYPSNPNSPDHQWPKGKCWPAGHASGGFALLSLYCLFRKKKHQISALVFAMGTGWIMGVYQVLRGAHFPSHHIITMFLALILVSILNIFIKDFKHESTQIKK
jgi:membrane-associated PAP2 superfamily phosphatase